MSRRGSAGWGRIFALAAALGAAGGAGGCSAPWILPGGGPGSHQFMLGESSGQSIRKISLWLEPGHRLAWELVRAPEEERRKLPLADLDFGEVPGAMDQIYPPGRVEPIAIGQVITVELQYGSDPDLDPVVPNLVTRWFQREAYGWTKITEREALDARPPKDLEGASGKP